MACPNRDMGSRLIPATTSHDRIARRIGMRLREMYGAPEAEPLPAEHVDLLLRLRQKERERLRLESV